MGSFLDLSGWDRERLEAVFAEADEYAAGRGRRFDGAAPLFFPASSIRTRATFERGLFAMGLQPIVFPPETLDKAEAHRDVAAYLAQWCDVTVVRHPRRATLQGLADAEALPVVNAMTDDDHPCEITGDLYAISRMGRPVFDLRYVFVGASGNIGLAWKHAADALGLDLIQCAPADLAMPGMSPEEDLITALTGADVVLTDPPGPHAAALAPYRITREAMAVTAPGALLNPCPPFVRDREITADLVDAGDWVGHAFKRSLLPVQQAIVSWCLTG